MLEKNKWLGNGRVLRNLEVGIRNMYEFLLLQVLAENLGVKGETVDNVGGLRNSMDDEDLRVFSGVLSMTYNLEMISKTTSFR